MNEQYFCRLFKKAIGYSPIEYVNEYRIKQAKRLLEETSLQVTEVCLECGFNNLGNFLQEFPETYRDDAIAVPKARRIHRIRKTKHIKSHKTVLFSSDKCKTFHAIIIKM